MFLTTSPWSLRYATHAGVIECYETGVFFETNSTNGIILDEDFELSDRVWDRFGASNHPSE